jgi:hypothetical protein
MKTHITIEIPRNGHVDTVLYGICLDLILLPMVGFSARDPVHNNLFHLG